MCPLRCVQCPELLVCLQERDQWLYLDWADCVWSCWATELQHSLNKELKIVPTLRHCPTNTPAAPEAPAPCLWREHHDGCRFKSHEASTTVCLRQTKICGKKYTPCIIWSFTYYRYCNKLWSIRLILSTNIINAACQGWNEESMLINRKMIVSFSSSDSMSSFTLTVLDPYLLLFSVCYRQLSLSSRDAILKKKSQYQHGTVTISAKILNVYFTRKAVFNYLCLSKIISGDINICLGQVEWDWITEVELFQLS